MNPSIAFNIKNAEFSYSGRLQDSVLFIEDLAIPKGKVVFVLGASGCGKSTLLEALGLMNNTLCDGDLHFQPLNEGIDLGKVWNDKQRLYDVRKEHFSFIFQNTNLMESFTAYENVSLPLMIQSDESQLESYIAAEVLMRSVGLPTEAVGFEKMAYNLSGGQRQRLSFVRALNSKFDVLFCDEPTGNLDRLNAKELFEIIRKSISNDQTAIIVTHDIELALQYADIILCLSKNEAGKGILKTEHTYFPNESNIKQIRNDILGQYISRNNIKTEAAKIPKELESQITKSKFENLFRKREGKSIMGKRYLNLLILFSIFAVTFLAIGFSNGSRIYINDKMNNPFVQWITVQIPFAVEPEYIDSLMREFRNGSVKKEFEIKNLSTYFVSNGVYFNSIDKSDKKEIRGRGRTFDFENGKPDPILEDLLTDKNLLVGRKDPFESEDEMGIVVTERLLKEMGFQDNNVPFLPLEFRIPSDSSDEDRRVLIPIPVRSVVKDIVGKIDLGFTKQFFFALRDNNGMFNPDSYRSLRFHIKGDQKEADIFRAFLNAWFKTHSEYGPVVKKIKPFTIGYAGGFTVKVIFKETDFTPAFLDASFAAISKDQKYAAQSITRIYDFTEAQNKPVAAKAEYISINFSKLDKIEPFAKYLLDLKKGDKEFALEVDTSRVKEKKNFNFLSKILLTISILLIAFAAISICLFISNLLRMHLEKVRMNIGTFMAFGLAGRRVRNVYFQIILIFIFSSMAIGLQQASVLENCLTW